MCDLVNCAYSFTDDACYAFEEYEQNPQNSSLSSMLPCKNDTDATKLLIKIGSTIHSFIAEVENSNVVQSDYESQKEISLFN